MTPDSTTCTTATLTRYGWLLRVQTVPELHRDVPLDNVIRIACNGGKPVRRGHSQARNHPAGS